MTCIPTFAPWAMATTQLTRIVAYENTCQEREAGSTERSLRMSWIVTTDQNGNKKLQMLWSGSDKG